MSDNQTDFKKLSVLLTRIIYFVSNIFAIDFLFSVEDGSLLFPTEDFGVFDAFIGSFICVLISFFSIRFALNNNNNNSIEVIVLISSVAYGAYMLIPI